MRHTQFSDPIFQSNSEANEFDITYIDNTHLKYHKEHYKDFNSKGELNIGVYIVKLMVKIAETSQLNRRKFIDYQVRIHKNPIKWLHEVDQLIHLNAFQFEENTDERESFYDFKKIILQKAEELENQQANGNITNSDQKIQSHCYQKFLTLFEYDYMIPKSTLFYYTDLKVNINLVFKELLNNLINLNAEEKKAYFEKLKFEIKLICENAHDTSEDVAAFISKYCTKEFNILESFFCENGLYKILSSPDEIADTSNPSETEAEVMNIQFAFFNYYYTDFLNQLLSFIDDQEKIYFPSQSIHSFKSELFWKKYDIDLLELITALMESGSINNQTMNLTRKDAIKLFESFFNTSIKDAESKLSKGTIRKRDSNPFLTSLVKAFKDYSEKKLD